MGSVLHIGLFPAYGQFSLNGTSGASTRPPQPCTPAVPTNVYSGRYPLALNLASAVFAYWRVKTYRLMGTLDFYHDGDFDGSQTYDVIIPGVVTTEKDLVCGDQYWIAEDFGINTTRFALLAAPVFVGENYGPNLARAGDVFRPAFLFRDDQGGGGTEFSTDPNEGATQSDGGEVIAFAGEAGAPIYMGAYYSDIQGVLTISEEEYWPYDPGDGGGPVWDSASGGLLRPDMIV